MIRPPGPLWLLAALLIHDGLLSPRGCPRSLLRRVPPTLVQVGDCRERKARPLALHSSTTSRSSGPACRRTVAAPVQVHISSALEPEVCAVSRTRRV